jgi:drug/metabolite transporter (DMT)-like permease
MTASSTRTNWILFFVLGFFWGSSYLFIKIGVETVPPLTLIAGRLAIGAALLGVALWFSRERLPRGADMYGRLIVMSILNIVIPFSLITWGEQSIDSGIASVLNGTVPLFTIVFAALVLADEAITVNRVVGLIVGFIGIFVLTGDSISGGLGGDQALGELALLASAVAYAVGNVFTKRVVRGLTPTVMAFFQIFISFVIVLILAVIVEQPLNVRPSTESLLAVVWLGLMGSGFAYVIFFRLLRDWGSTRASLVAYLLPVVGLILGAVVLQEPVDLGIVVGTALVIGGIALVNSRYGQRRIFGRDPAVSAETASR